MDGLLIQSVQSTTQPTGTASLQKSQDSAAPASDSQQLTAEDQSKIQKLRQRDREVRNHEQAHLAAGGQHITSGATYSYQQGPDGQRYAVGGEVGIDTSPESDPAATIRKMQAVRAAALAPASPSGQDRQVAASATRQAAQARADLAAEQAEKADPEKEGRTAADNLPSAEEKGAPPGSLIDTKA